MLWFVIRMFPQRPHVLIGRALRELDHGGAVADFLLGSGAYSGEAGNWGGTAEK